MANMVPLVFVGATPTSGGWSLRLVVPFVEGCLTLGVDSFLRHGDCHSSLGVLARNV